MKQEQSFAKAVNTAIKSRSPRQLRLLLKPYLKTSTMITTWLHSADSRQVFDISYDWLTQAIPRLPKQAVAELAFTPQKPLSSMFIGGIPTMFESLRLPMWPGKLEVLETCMVNYWTSHACDIISCLREAGDCFLADNLERVWKAPNKLDAVRCFHIMQPEFDGPNMFRCFGLWPPELYSKVDGDVYHLDCRYLDCDFKFLGELNGVLYVLHQQRQIPIGEPVLTAFRQRTGQVVWEVPTVGCNSMRHAQLHPLGVFCVNRRPGEIRVFCLKTGIWKWTFKLPPRTDYNHPFYITPRGFLYVPTNMDNAEFGLCGAYVTRKGEWDWSYLYDTYPHSCLKGQGEYLTSERYDVTTICSPTEEQVVDCLDVHLRGDTGAGLYVNDLCKLECVGGKWQRTLMPGHSPIESIGFMHDGVVALTNQHDHDLTLLEDWKRSRFLHTDLSLHLGLESREHDCIWITTSNISTELHKFTKQGFDPNWRAFENKLLLCFASKGKVYVLKTN